MLSRSAPVLALAFAVTSLVALAPRTAHAGCMMECTSIENEGFTIDPPLPCLTVVGAPDDNTCVCASTVRLRNDCASAVHVTPVAKDGSCDRGSCTAFDVEIGKDLVVEVRDKPPTSDSGPKSTNHVSAKYTAVELGDAKKTEHTIEVKAVTTMDPEASACSASPRPRRRGSSSGALALVLGVAFAGIVRASRRRVRV